WPSRGKGSHKLGEPLGISQVALVVLLAAETESGGPLKVRADVVPLLEYVHAPHRLDQERQPAVRWRPTLEVRDPLLLGEALLLPARPPKQQMALTAPIRQPML